MKKKVDTLPFWALSQDVRDLVLFLLQEELSFETRRWEAARLRARQWREATERKLAELEEVVPPGPIRDMMLGGAALGLSAASAEEIPASPYMLALVSAYEYLDRARAVDATVLEAVQKRARALLDELGRPNDVGALDAACVLVAEGRVPDGRDDAAAAIDAERRRLGV